MAPSVEAKHTDQLFLTVYITPAVNCLLQLAAVTATCLHSVERLTFTLEFYAERQWVPFQHLTPFVIQLATCGCPSPFLSKGKEKINNCQ